MCRCRVGVRHDTCPTSGHGLIEECPCFVVLESGKGAFYQSIVFENSLTRISCGIFNSCKIYKKNI